ncbi:MAG: GTP cyclohydrolase FolE2 [Microgenomates group bacterium]|nr:GTP cyclohydrolase FolE2 [Microgenomates group bacterium]
MIDVHAKKDNRGIAINKVGITDLDWPIYLSKNNRSIAKINILTNLTETQKGIHMSRLVEVLYPLSKKILSKKTIADLLISLRQQIGCSEIFFDLNFNFIKEKKSPKSGKKSYLSYDCFIKAKLVGEKVSINLGVKVPIFLLCPCSLAISKSAAHNQRARVTLLVTPKRKDWFDDLINLVEKNGSHELFSILKRKDEKYVIDEAVKKAKFVEDVVRDIAQWLKKRKYKAFIVEAKSFESIHNHNALASITYNEKFFN